MWRELGKEECFRLLVRKSEAKRPIGGPKFKWMNDMKVALGETEWSSVDCIGTNDSFKRCLEIPSCRIP
jgi:hypothetical protein